MTERERATGREIGIVRERKRERDFEFIFFYFTTVAN